MTRKTTKPDTRELPKQVQTAISEMAELEATLILTPAQLLGVMMKVVLEERISDAEIDRICTAYYYAIGEAGRLQGTTMPPDPQLYGPGKRV